MKKYGIRTYEVLLFQCGIVNLFSSRITKAEIERGYINNPSARPAVFLFLPEERYALPQSVKGQGRQNDTNISLVLRPLPWLEEPGDKGIPTFVNKHVRTIYMQPCSQASPVFVFGLHLV